MYIYIVVCDGDVMSAHRSEEAADQSSEALIRRLAKGYVDFPEVEEEGFDIIDYWNDRTQGDNYIQVQAVRLVE